jgi:hypothetical protein
MCAIDELELVVTPARALRALVLAVADLCRVGRQCVLGSRRREVQLDHLPVAFVLVVEIVEDIEEPVLQRELPRERALGGDACVRRCRHVGGDAVRPLVVRAAGAECPAGKVEVVAEEAPREVLRGRGDLHDVGRIPGPS